ncbi:MAG: Hsp70 family protein [Phycisphaerales bacterium]
MGLNRPATATGTSGGGSATAGRTIVGIDLGTTNSLIAVCDERGPRVVPDIEGRALLPSVVRYRSGGAPIVGHEARAERLRFPAETIWSVKRLMGRALRDVGDDVREVPYAIVEGPRGMACVAPLGGPARPITPQEVSAEILRRLRAQAERALGGPVERAVVTVPAYFDDAQRQATRDAGRLAGLDVVRIVNEPTAAALAYGIGVRSRVAETIAVYDLGGGTFDVSILRVEPGVTDDGSGAADYGSGVADNRPGVADDRRDVADNRPGVAVNGPDVADDGSDVAAAPPSVSSFFQVIATAGDTRLGGDDLDAALADELARRWIAASPGIDTIDREALRSAAERAKIALSVEERTTVRLAAPDRTLRGGEARSGASRGGETDGEKACGDEARGGETRGGEVRGGGAHGGTDGEREGDALFECVIDRATLEALAAPIVERTLACCRRALSDARLEPAEIDRVVMVGGMTRMPSVRRAVAELFGRTPYTAIDPDQVVALGAAVQAAILAGVERGALLLDVLPLSLGIETVGGAVAKLVPRNASVPTRAREFFSTSVDGQTSVKIHVLQGERELVRDCRSLGEFHLRGIPPMPAGIPQIEVEFLVDANGILDVSAVERRSGRRAAIQVVPAFGLTREEVDRMERESVEHARADMQAHRVIDLVVNTQLDVKWIREAMERVRDRLEPDYASALDGRIADVERMIAAARADAAGVDANAFHAAKQALDEASMRVHEIAIVESLRGGDAAMGKPGRPTPE